MLSQGQNILRNDIQNLVYNVIHKPQRECLFTASVSTKVREFDLEIVNKRSCAELPEGGE